MCGPYYSVMVLLLAEAMWPIVVVLLLSPGKPPHDGALNRVFHAVGPGGRSGLPGLSESRFVL